MKGERKAPRASRAALAAALLAAALALPARAGLFDDEEARKDIAGLRQQVGALEARLAGIEEQLKSQALLEILNQIEALRQEVAKLRGQVEELKHADEASQKRQKDFYLDLDTRLKRLEQPGAAAAPAGAPAVDPAAAQKPAAAADASAEVRAYDAAYNLFKIGNYQGAIAGFQNFLKVYPASIFAPNAYYWIGNAFFNLRDFKSAIATQQKLIAAYPDSPKAPDALLNIASSQQEMGDAAGARKTLQELAQKYPVSDAAEKAKRRLATGK